MGCRVGDGWLAVVTWGASVLLWCWSALAKFGSTVFLTFSANIIRVSCPYCNTKHVIPCYWAYTL